MASLTRRSDSKKSAPTRKSYFIVGKKWSTDPNYCKTLTEYGEQEKQPVFSTANGNPKIEKIEGETLAGREYEILVMEIPCENCAIRFDLKKSNTFREGQIISLDSVRIHKETFPGEDPHYYATGDVV